jgi:hypothetical protein
MRKDKINVDSIIRDMGELSPMERAVLVGYLVAERPQGQTVKEQRAAYAGEQRASPCRPQTAERNRRRVVGGRRVGGIA